MSPHTGTWSNGIQSIICPSLGNKLPLHQFSGKSAQPLTKIHKSVALTYDPILHKIFNIFRCELIDVRVLQKLEKPILISKDLILHIHI